MVFTLFHPLISFLFFYAARHRLEMFSFLLAAVLPDIESIYYALQALSVCALNDIVCLAEYPSHYFLHSIIGIVVLAFFAVFAAAKFRALFKLTEYKTKVLYASALLGGFSHLFVDTTVHKGADALALFWPFDMRVSFVFSGSYLLWNLAALVSAVLILYLWKKNKLQEIVK